MTASSNVDIYRVHLMSGSKLKMNALGKLAEGTTKTIFDACVLLHEAARAEERALASLPTTAAVTRLGTAIEVAWCLVEGRDPPGAAAAWSEIVLLREAVDSTTADGMLSRLEPLYARAHDGFAKRLSKCRTLGAARSPQVLVPPSLPEATKALAEVDNILRYYPGASSFWWAKYRILEHLDNFKEAWIALSHARLLEPQRAGFLAMSLLLSVRALSAKEAALYVGSFRSRLEGAGASVCLLYALAAIELARKGDTKARWSDARNAANAGLAQATSPTLRSALRATQLLLDALAVGKAPTLDIFYRAGLGDVAASMPTGAVALTTVVDAVASLAA
jgi:hypothetical protein